MKQFSRLIPYFCRAYLRTSRQGKSNYPTFNADGLEDERIRGSWPRSSRSFPIGALMVLETGGETSFIRGPWKGVSLPNGVEPDLLVLDGQQRLTSLFQATDLRLGCCNNEYPEAADQALVLLRHVPSTWDRQRTARTRLSEYRRTRIVRTLTE